MRADKVRFISLSDALLPRSRMLEAAVVSESAGAESGVASSADAALHEPVAALTRTSPANSDADVGAICAARLFRAAIGDAFDAILVDLCRELAVEILARELRLADADIATIARRLIDERWSDEPIRLHVAPSEADIACELPVCADPSLQPGDAILECRDGSIDARLGVRLAALLAALRP